MVRFIRDGDTIKHWSYFGKDGVLRTGWQKMGIDVNPDGDNKQHWSYFGANGWLTTGWKKLTKADGAPVDHFSYFGTDGWLRTGLITFEIMHNSLKKIIPNLKFMYATEGGGHSKYIEKGSLVFNGRGQSYRTTPRLIYFK